MTRPALACFRGARGFTLVEMGVVLAVVATLAALAVPGWLDQLTRSRRAEARSELQRLQWAQERHLEQHGRFADTLSSLLPLSAGGISANGHYRVELRSRGPDSYELVARAQGVQQRDRQCPAMTLRVNGAISLREPEGSCWSL